MNKNDEEMTNRFIDAMMVDHDPDWQPGDTAKFKEERSEEEPDRDFSKEFSILCEEDAPLEDFEKLRFAMMAYSEARNNLLQTKRDKLKQEHADMMEAFQQKSIELDVESGAVTCFSWEIMKLNRKITELEMPAYLKEYPRTETFIEDIGKAVADLGLGLVEFDRLMDMAKKYRRESVESVKANSNPVERAGCDIEDVYDEDTKDRTPVEGSDYKPVWMVNETDGNISITGKTGNQWTILAGSDPLILTEDEYEEFALSEDGKALIERGKLSLASSAQVATDEFLAQKRKENGGSNEVD